MTATMVDRMEYFLETRPFLTQERMMATTAKAMESKQEMSSSSIQRVMMDASRKRIWNCKDRLYTLLYSFFTTLQSGVLAICLNVNALNGLARKVLVAVVSGRGRALA